MQMQKLYKRAIMEQIIPRPIIDITFFRLVFSRSSPIRILLIIPNTETIDVIVDAKIGE